MKKKIIIPAGLGLLILIFVVSQIVPGRTIVIECDNGSKKTSLPDSIELNVYVENSGSMDGYMCRGSNLKDAVYDYISNLKKYVAVSRLFYINSQTIPCKVSLDDYIKELTPQSFATAGGNRGNTDLRDIFKKVLSYHSTNTVSVFISDCILDISQSSTDYFGNCQVSIKNTFVDAIDRCPNLGVQIVKLQSKFDGFWFCGKNTERLINVKRPYYIWIIGNANVLAMFNKYTPISDVLGGIQNYCAFSTTQFIPFEISTKRYKINHSGKIMVEILVDLSGALQEEKVLQDKDNYTLSNSQQVSIASIRPISKNGSIYSHVIDLELNKPQNLKSVEITFSYPQLPDWVILSNDSTGIYDNSLDKTTGILSLVKGVSGAYKEYVEYGKIEFNLKNI